MDREVVEEVHVHDGLAVGEVQVEEGLVAEGQEAEGGDRRGTHRDREVRRAVEAHAHEPDGAQPPRACRHDGPRGGRAWNLEASHGHLRADLRASCQLLARQAWSRVL